MDRIDLMILAILQEYASVSIAEIANRVHLSQTPCWRRLQKLQAAAVIERRAALLDPRAIGLDLTIFLEIQTGDNSGDCLKRFGETVSPTPVVLIDHRSTGEDHILL